MGDTEACYTYSLNGQRLSVRDANNNRSVYVYDGLDRLCRLYFPVTTLGANAANTGGVADASLTCASAGTAPDYEGYGYDSNGNRTSLRLRSSETIAFTYDNLNRESVKDIPGGTVTDVYSAYDLAGRRLSARFVSASGQGIVYTYDTAGRLASETNTIGASRALGYQYDIASNRTRVTWPDATYASYTYDALNRVDLVQENGTTTLADYAYDTLARRATITRGNGAVTTYSYDNASRLTGLQQDLSGTADDQTLGFAYTAASQVSQRTASNDNFNWVAAAVNRNYNRNGLNQYISTTGTGAASFAYDLRGNLTSDGSRTFAYDLENRLIQVSGAASGSLNYDPLGRLRQYTASSATTDFLYDGDRLSAEYNSSGVLLRRYVHGPGVDEPLVWYEGSGTSDRRYLITDQQGSVIAENGASTTRYSYGPYGEPNTWTGSRFRYTGQIALPELQLYHYKARALDPVLGRFLQTDPVGYEGDDLNLYQYALNDPIGNADATGRRVVANFYRDSGLVIAVDLDSGERVVARAFSGGWYRDVYGGPVPDGSYTILEGKDSNHYRLERNDSDFGDDATPEGRSQLRLHPRGTISLGCITCSGDLGGDELGELIEGTENTFQTEVESQSRNPFASRRESLVNYGTLRVHSTGAYQFNAETREVTREVTHTGSRLPTTEHVCTFNDEGRCE